MIKFITFKVVSYCIGKSGFFGDCHMKKISIEYINKIPKNIFTKEMKGLLNSEKSYFILDYLEKKRPFKDLEKIFQCMLVSSNKASDELFLSILQDQSVLGIESKKLKNNSLNEQKKSGLRNLSPYLEKRLFTLNEAYTAKFGFPFIIIHRGLSIDKIFSEFERSLADTFETRFLTSKNEIEKLFYLRLKDLVHEK